MGYRGIRYDGRIAGKTLDVGGYVGVIFRTSSGWEKKVIVVPC